MQNAQHPDAKIVAVLHDILEDTATSVTDLRSLGFVDISTMPCVIG